VEDGDELIGRQRSGEPPPRLAQARRMLGRPKKCKSARAFLMEHYLNDSAALWLGRAAIANVACFSCALT
jgi:hypothetical protein